MTVLYRRWRPQTFAEVTGQEHITRTLLNALKAGRVAHAYLFSGPRGTGKTSTGRILAKAVNCLQNGHGEPCNQCSLCQDITQGRALDVVEVDAASNRGIDEARSLRERVAFAPSQARYKVYIIDEVHMLTEAASNALLKTLEEPPEYALFILATTEPQLVLPTIHSRCQRFDFRRLSRAAVASRLQTIAEKEGLTLTPEAERLIAKSAGGSLRDAENLFEQLVSYFGPAVDLPQVQDLLGLRADLRARDLVRKLIYGDLAGGLGVINQVAAEGGELRAFQREVVDYLRGLLLIKGGSPEAVEATLEERAEMASLAAIASLEGLVKALRLFAAADLRWDSTSPLPLELALTEALPTPLSSHPEPPIHRPAEPAIPRTLEPTIPRPPEPVGVVPGRGGKEDGLEAGPAPPVSLDYLKHHWREVVNQFRGMGSQGNLDALLRSACQPIGVEGDTIVLGFFYPYHKDKVEDEKYRHLVERRLSEIFQTPCRVRCVLTPRQKRPLSQEPLVRAAMELGARIVEGERDEQVSNAPGPGAGGPTG